MSKKFLTVVALMLVAALVLPTFAIAQDDYAGYLRYPITSDPPHLDAFTQTTTATARAIGPVFEYLVRYDYLTGEFEPEIAESWDVTENEDGYQVITFHLRDGVLFHDVAGLDYGEEGRQVTADDIKWNYLRFADGNTEIAERAFLMEPILGAKAYTDGEADDIPGLVVVDPQTFQIILEVPNRLFMISGMIRIAAPEAYEQLGEAAYNTPVGTGPYKFVEWLPENRLVYEANPDYWNPELPKNPGILFTNYGDANTALLDYRENNLDFLFDFPSGQRQAILDEFPDDYNEKPGLHIRYWGFQFENEFIAQNPLVRQAISHALDRVTAWEIFEEGSRYPADLGILPRRCPPRHPRPPMDTTWKKPPRCLKKPVSPVAKVCRCFRSTCSIPSRMRRRSCSSSKVWNNWAFRLSSPSKTAAPIGTASKPPPFTCSRPVGLPTIPIPPKCSIIWSWMVRTTVNTNGTT